MLNLKKKYSNKTTVLHNKKCVSGHYWRNYPANLRIVKMYIYIRLNIVNLGCVILVWCRNFSPIYALYFIKFTFNKFSL